MQRGGKINTTVLVREHPGKVERSRQVLRNEQNTCKWNHGLFTRQFIEPVLFSPVYVPIVLLGFVCVALAGKERGDKFRFLNHFSISRGSTDIGDLPPKHGITRLLRIRLYVAAVVYAFSMVASDWSACSSIFDVLSHSCRAMMRIRNSPALYSFSALVLSRCDLKRISILFVVHTATPVPKKS